MLTGRFLHPNSIMKGYRNSCLFGLLGANCVAKAALPTSKAAWRVYNYLPKRQQ